MKKKVNELKFYFSNICYEVRPWREFPKNLTIGLLRDHWASRGSYIIIVNLCDEDEVDTAYLGKIYNIRRVTTFDSSISIREIIKIDLDWERLIKETQGNSANDILITDYPVPLNKNTSSKIKNEILSLNSGVLDESYFCFKRIVSNSNQAIFTQFVDAFILALNLFGFGSKYMPVVNEDQILKYDLAAIFPHIQRTNNGRDYYFNILNKYLIIKAFNNTQIRDCFGIDLIYNYENEGRAIIVRYEFLDDLRDNTSSDYVSNGVTIDNIISEISECYNSQAMDSDELRICKCPIYIKLISRNIKEHRYTPSGFYYPICILSRFYHKSKKDKLFNNKHKISNRQFLDLADVKLIGSNLIQYEQITEYLIKNARNHHRLILLFIETSNPPEQEHRFML